MARIQTPQHVQELQAEFKVREPFGLELLESIQPTYQLGRQKIASVGFPKRCFGAISGAAGGVGTNLELALECPAGRGIIILLESVSIENTNGRMTGRITDGVAMASVTSNPLTKAFQDGRTTDSLPDGIFNVANPLTAAPNGSFIGQYSCRTDETLILPFNVVLGGAAYFLMRHSSANVGATVNFMWTEFLLEDR